MSIEEAGEKSDATGWPVAGRFALDSRWIAADIAEYLAFYVFRGSLAYGQGV
jgi:hypothetical protein